MNGKNLEMFIENAITLLNLAKTECGSGNQSALHQALQYCRKSRRWIAIVEDEIKEIMD